MKAYGTMESKTCINELGHMTKIAPYPFMVKTSKNLFSRTNLLISMELGM